MPFEAFRPSESVAKRGLHIAGVELRFGKFVFRDPGDAFNPAGSHDCQRFAEEVARRAEVAIEHTGCSECVERVRSKPDCAVIAEYLERRYYFPPTALDFVRVYQHYT